MKLYIESARRVSGTAEDFVYQLPTCIDVPTSLACVDCVLVPNTIYSIKADTNDRLYLKEAYVAQAGGTPSIAFRVVVLSPGQYNGVSLANVVAAALNSGSTMGPNSYAVSYDLDLARLRISTSAPHTSFFVVYGDLALPDAWDAIAPSLIAGEPRSANKACGFGSVETVTGTGLTPAIGPDVVDVQRHHIMYIHSDLGIPGVSYGPRGETDIIRRVILEAPQNALAVDRHSTAHDVVEVASQPLRSIRFSLRGSDGKVVDLRGHEWSFSIIFYDKLG